jgi:erythritol transport system ATP-binding protein
VEESGSLRHNTSGGHGVNPSASEIVLQANGVTKRYPGTVALDAINFRAYRGKVNVLIGENGAGKSTLMRILAGVETPDEGELVLDGSPVRICSPRDAARHRIAIVHQELSILSNMDIAENVFAGREPTRAGVVVDRGTEERRAAHALDRLRKPLRVRSQAAGLPLGCRQIVEVARALDQGARILILDEPTSALSNAETASLFEVIDELKRAGVTIIYISHRLNELLHLGDYFTVLRSGRVVGEESRQAVSRQWIVTRMSGRDVIDSASSTCADSRGGTIFQVNGLSLESDSSEEGAQAPLHNLTFSVRKGEILGIYGLLGSGRTELLESIAGARSRTSGTLFLNGRELHFTSVAEAVKAGILLVPEDRQRDGIIPDLSIRENMTLGAGKSAVLNKNAELQNARHLAAELAIAARDLELPITTLSGGNQQKVIIARCLMRSPSLLLLDEPTRGVDVGAKVEIYGILHKLAAQGIGILFTSSEIEETQALADRVLVLCQGRISAEFTGSQVTDDALFAAASPAVTALPVSSPGVVFG